MFQSGVVCAIIIVMTVLLSYLSGIILYANDTDHESEGQHFKFHFAKDFNSLVWNTCNRPSKKVLKNETSEKPTQPEKNLQWYIPSIWCSWDDMWWCREGIERWGWGKCGNISPDSSLWSVVVVLVESTDRLSRFLPPRQLAPGRSSRPGTHLGLLQHRQESSWSSPVTTTLARPPPPPLLQHRPRPPPLSLSLTPRPGPWGWRRMRRTEGRWLSYRRCWLLSVDTWQDLMLSSVWPVGCSSGRRLCWVHDVAGGDRNIQSGDTHHTLQWWCRPVSGVRSENIEQFSLIILTEWPVLSRVITELSRSCNRKASRS